jgi:hypothetical protein
MQGRTRLLALLVVVVAGLLSFSACGGGGGHTIVVPPTVAITPTTGNVPVGGTANFSVSVTNATNTAVTWKVNGVAGGNATTTGSISATGVFTAPTNIPSPATVSITAVSQQDNRTTSNTATITIIAAQGVLVSPSLIVVAGGGLQSFTATQGGNPIAVTWSASAGSIDVNGNFTAPPGPPAGGVVTITATTSTNQTGTASATILLANLLPAGHYAFAFSGQDFLSTNLSPTLAIAAGSFQTNGSGTIESGGEYTYNGSVCTQAGDTITGGTYVIGGDGRGTATIQTKLCGAFNWSFVMTSATNALIIEFDASTAGSFITGSGTIDQQTIPAAISNGNYVFNVSGVDANGPVAIAGSFTGAGGGNISPGVWDYNEAGSMLTGTTGDTTLTGLYTAVDANGGGQITFTSSAIQTSLTYFFYAVDSTHLKIVEFDSVAATAGDVFTAAASLTPALASSNYAFTVAGESATYPVFTVGGVFTVDSGTMTLTGGRQDFENTIGNNGNEALGSSPYNITSPSGLSRGTLSLNGSNGFRFVFYVAANGSVQLVENANIDAGFVSSGAAYQQSAIALTGGSYGINLTGVDLTNGGGEEDVSGQLTSSSSGAVSFGTLDVNDAANIVDGLFPNILLSGTSTLGTQSAIGYGNNANLVPKNQSAINPFGLSVYVIDSQTALISENDRTRIAIGMLVKQF